MILVNSEGLLIDKSKDIELCDEHIMVKKNGEEIFYMAAGLEILEVDAPEEIEPQKFKYIDGEFINIEPPVVEPEL